MPSSFVNAQTIQVTPNQGTHGDGFSVSGQPGGGPIARIYFSSQDVEINAKIGQDVKTYKILGEVGIDGGGNMNTFSSQVPTLMSDGDIDLPVINRTHYIYITRSTATNILAKAVFEVVGVTLNAELSFEEGYVGEELQITGDGFWPGEDIQILFDSVDITNDIVAGDPEAGDSGTDKGKFDVIVPVPASGYGGKTIKVKGLTSGIEVDLDFKVLAKLVLAPVSGQAGSQIAVTGTGFARSNFVDIYIDNTLILRTTQRTSSGTFLQLITIPADKAPGKYQIRARDATSPNTINASAIFEVEPVPLTPEITVTPTSGKVGDSITVSGTDFPPGETVTITVDGDTIGTATAGSNKAFSTTIEVGEAPAGAHTITASSGNYEASASFTIQSNVSIDKTSGKIGDEVTINGTGLAANAAIEIRFGTTDVREGQANQNGSFTLSFDVPSVDAGTHSIRVRAGGLTVFEADFTTSIEMSISPTTGKPGDQVTLDASGFAPGASAVITFNNTQVKTATVGTNGSLNETFAVPAVAEGTYEVKVTVNGISRTASFTTEAQTNFSPSSGPVGTQVSVSGTGFGPNKPLTLTFDGSAVPGSTGLTVNAEGAFNITFNIPPIQAGSYIISISDGTITETSSFSVSASTPPTPQLVAPAMGTKLDGPVTFNWQAVTYTVMDITYELQVSKSSNFATLVLDKKGLTEAEYTTIQAEQLEKATAEEPYYWRVRVVDEAGNTSAWSGAAQFAYGSSWPVWLTWVLISLGVIVLGILAFWLGRRIAYYSY